MSITQDQARTLAGGSGSVYSTDSEKIGSIGQIYVGETTGEPTFVTVKTGLFGLSESFVPLDGARVDGDDVIVPFDKDTIKDAPRIDPDGSLSPEQETQLYRYYRLDGESSDLTDRTDYGTGTRATGGVETGRHRGAVGHDTSGPTTDDAMTLSEEQINVGTQSREAGRARLRKYVVTENVTQTVPVSREEVRLEREPITEANVGAAMSGPEISEEEHEVVLHEERPVVEKEAVPRERVRLDTETVTENATVSEEVRKEEVEMTDPHTTTGTDRDPDRR